MSKNLANDNLYANTIHIKMLSGIVKDEILTNIPRLGEWIFEYGVDIECGYFVNFIEKNPKYGIENIVSINQFYDGLEGFEVSAMLREMGKETPEIMRHILLSALDLEV